jgi:hypothetical protein
MFDQAGEQRNNCEKSKKTWDKPGKNLRKPGEKHCKHDDSWGFWQ